MDGITDTGRRKCAERERCARWRAYSLKGSRALHQSKELPGKLVPIFFPYAFFWDYSIIPPFSPSLFILWTFHPISPLLNPWPPFWLLLYTRHFYEELMWFWGNHKERMKRNIFISNNTEIYKYWNKIIIQGTIIRKET